MSIALKQEPTKRIKEFDESYENFLHLRKDPELAELLLSKYNKYRDQPLGWFPAHEDEDAGDISYGATSSLSLRERAAPRIDRRGATLYGCICRRADYGLIVPYPRLKYDSIKGVEITLSQPQGSFTTPDWVEGGNPDFPNKAGGRREKALSRPLRGDFSTPWNAPTKKWIWI